MDFITFGVTVSVAQVRGLLLEDKVVNGGQAVVVRAFDTSSPAGFTISLSRILEGDALIKVGGSAVASVQGVQRTLSRGFTSEEQQLSIEFKRFSRTAGRAAAAAAAGLGAAEMCRSGLEPAAVHRL